VWSHGLRMCQIQQECLGLALHQDQVVLNKKRVYRTAKSTGVDSIDLT